MVDLLLSNGDSSLFLILRPAMYSGGTSRKTKKRHVYLIVASYGSIMEQNVTSQSMNKNTKGKIRAEWEEKSLDASFLITHAYRSTAT